MARRSIYCCACKGEVQAALVRGHEVYPRRPDLATLPFWRCPDCRNFVGCHHKSHDRIRPLGCIPTQAIRDMRKLIHQQLDPIWKAGLMERKRLYKLLTAKLGREYHTAELRTEEEAQAMYLFIERLSRRLSP
jgi:hypothetical protein